jgi:hypothetical protein
MDENSIPKDFPLKDAPKSWRDDIRVMERICVHGIGHPDPELEYEGVDAVHSCDGCCWTEAP